MVNLRFPFCIVLLLISVINQSAYATLTQDFNTGISAFDQADYDKALIYFKKAESAGLDSAQLRYNLGSVYYKLAQYDLSREYFNSLLVHPALRFQAQYSLALIEHRTGNIDAAVSLFEQSIELTEDARLKALALRQIQILTKKDRKDDSIKPWFLFLSPAYGYDSNISHTPSSDASNESGTFLQLLLYADLELYKINEDSIHTSLTHYSKDYTDHNEFNLSTTILGADYRHRANNWDMIYGVDLERSSFSGDDYLANSALRLSAKKPLLGNNDFRMSLKYEDINSLSSKYDFLDGNRILFKSEYRNRLSQQAINYIYQLELNDRENLDTQNFSPTRHLIGVEYHHSFSTEIKGGIKFDYRDSDYESIADQNRRDKRTRLGFNGSYQLYTDWTAKLDILFTRNRSSQQISDYRNHLTTLSLNMLF